MDKSVEQLAAEYGAANNFAELFKLARVVGMEAGLNKRPVPMAIVAADLLGRPLPGAQVHVVDEGCCGFAWVKIFPGNCPAANAAKRLGLARKAYGGGVEIWVSDFGQSLERKDAYALSYASVLQAAGIKAYAGSRMD